MTDKYAVQFELGIQAEDISSYFVFYLQFHILLYYWVYQVFIFRRRAPVESFINFEMQSYIDKLYASNDICT